MSRFDDIRFAIASIAVLCIGLAPILAPCGAPEPSFDQRVRDHLVRAGYLNPLDILEPFDASSHSDRCRLARLRAIAHASPSLIASRKSSGFGG